MYWFYLLFIFPGFLCSKLQCNSGILNEFYTHNLYQGECAVTPKKMTMLTFVVKTTKKTNKKHTVVLNQNCPILLAYTKTALFQEGLLQVNVLPRLCQL